MSSPLQEFQNKHKERWNVLQDIPAWEVETVINWLRNIFVYVDTSGMYTEEKYQYSVVRSIETENRLLISNDMGINTGSWEQMRGSLLGLLRAEDYRNIIVFLECVVKYVRESDRGVLYRKNFLDSNTVLSQLEISLERGSKWKIEFTKGSEIGLMERVDPKITKMAVDLDIDYLTKAWNEAFSVSPKPDKAIENAQHAIELIASEKGLTKDTTSVYGKLIGDIRSHPDKYISAANEAFALSEKLATGSRGTTDINHQFAEWFWNGLDLIQKSNPAHHSSKSTNGFSLSPDAGKQATLIATLICQLISSDYFFKATKG